MPTVIRVLIYKGSNHFLDGSVTRRHIRGRVKMGSGTISEYFVTTLLPLLTISHDEAELADLIFPELAEDAPPDK